MGGRREKVSEHLGFVRRPTTTFQNENLDDGVSPDNEMGEAGRGNGIEQCDGDGEGGWGGGNGDDDSMDDDEHDNEVLEENRSGPEEEEEEEQEDPFQQDHVEVTDLLHLLNRSVTPPPPPRLRLILCLVNLRNKLL